MYGVGLVAPGKKWSASQTRLGSQGWLSILSKSFIETNHSVNDSLYETKLGAVADHHSSSLSYDIIHFHWPTNTFVWS